jgi:hypothetical protein
MRYLMMICGEEDGTEEDPDEVRAIGPAYAAFMAEMAPREVLQGGHRLRPTRYATSVRVRDGEVLVSDGPFAETKEQVGGYYLVDATDLDEAIEVASKIPGAAVGTIEIRPIWEMEM